MRTIVSSFIISVLIILYSCGTSKEIFEDFHTETYTARMEQFYSQHLDSGAVVFFGNSITQAGKWSDYFDESKIVNRGISGDNTEGMLARINEIASYKPAKIFIMAGINDISLSRSNSKIMKNYRALIEEIIRTSPNTMIYIQSVLPINNDFGVYTRLSGKENQIIDLNKRLFVLAAKEGLEYINLHSLYCDENGKLREEFTNDGIHLYDEAYYLWANIIRNKIE